MVLMRVVLSSLATAAVFALFGSMCLQALFNQSEPGVVLFIGLVGAVVGAIAAAAEAIVGQLRNGPPAGPASTNP
jgi:ABC-type enterochelin transport system permease subunit